MMPCSDTARNVSQAERRKRAAKRRKVGRPYGPFAGNAPEDGLNAYRHRHGGRHQYVDGWVTQAGYSIADEAPIFVAIFAVPAAIAELSLPAVVPGLTLAIWSIL